jgi:hypothetical protein
MIERWTSAVEVRCPVEDQVSCHLGYPPRQSDFEDMRRLADRFGLELPEPYLSP